MDLTEEETLAETLSRLNNNTIKLGSDPGYGAIPSMSWTTEPLSQLTTDQLKSISISSLDANINGTTYSNISAVGGLYSGTYGPTWTTTGINTSPYTISNPVTVDRGGKIALQGDNADIDINGKSLKSWMEQVEQRLNILAPNTKLEEEWEELKALGEQYRKLEQHIKDKQATWDRLKAMPPPIAE